MSLFVKGILFWLVSCIVLISIERVIHLYFSKNREYNYKKMDKTLEEDHMIKINLMRDHNFGH